MEETKAKTKKNHKVLKVILLIILLAVAIFTVCTVRKVIIIKKLQDNLRKQINVDNYHITTATYQGDSLNIVDSYRYNEKSAIKVQIFSDNVNRKMYQFNNGKTVNTFIENEDEKVAVLNQESGVMVEIADYLGKTNWLETFGLSALASINSVKINGKDCYCIQNYKSGNFLFETEGPKVYIEKDTGLLIRTSGGKVLSDTDININDYSVNYQYEFNKVTDAEFVEPDVNEYRINK